MLSEDQLEIISEAIQPLFQYLEHEVIVDIARRIEATMSYSRTAELKAIAMYDLGYSPAKIRAEALKILRADKDYEAAVAENTLEHKKKVKKLLKEILGEGKSAVSDIMKDAGNMSWADDLSLWQQAGKDLTDNSFLKELVDAFSKQTNRDLQNFTQTTGFKSMAGYESVQDVYKRELDRAMIKICTGTFSRDKVLEDVVHNLAQSGLRTIDFASGYSMQLDTAARLALRTSAHQLAGRIMDKNIEQTGENLVYVSKHWGARNTGIGHANHEQWQGKVYFIRDGTDYSGEARRIGQDRITSLWYATGYSADGTRQNDPLGLYGYNCKHNHYAWFEGSSEFPAEDPEPAPIEIDGKTYDYYAITQKMRSMERSIRALKREREVLKSLNQDTKEITKKIKQKTKDYFEFCEKAKVKDKSERLRYECGTSNLKKTKAWKEFETSAAQPQKAVADFHKNDTMETAKEEKGIQVHTVGKIDRDIYKCITEDIVTDEVIITDERIKHIIERRGREFYEKYNDKFLSILKEPDYIFRDNMNTALVCKEFAIDNKYVNLVLRLVVSSDNPEYKNSIITAVGENKRRFQQRLRNHKPLYKKE